MLLSMALKSQLKLPIISEQQVSVSQEEDLDLFMFD